MSDLKRYIELGRPLYEEEMESVIQAMLEGVVDTDDIANFLSALAERGETVDELVGAVKALRKKSLKINAPYDAVDCCGTGGDGQATYNISTAVSFVVAGCGIPVAKHGNRASSSKSGTADVLEALGVNLDLPLASIEESIEIYNFAFLMATKHNSAVQNVTEARRKLGTRTIFNLVGPLINPANTTLQLIGVYDRKWTVPFAETLKKLGTKRAWIVHGEDGLDEITITGTTYAAILDEEGYISERELTPEAFGLERGSLDDIRGGDAEENAKALRAVLEGGQSAYRSIVLANAAAVLCIHDPSLTLDDAIMKASDSIDNGAALRVLRDYVAFSRSVM